LNAQQPVALLEDFLMVEWSLFDTAFLANL
jgi:hypothetical protein